MFCSALFSDLCHCITTLYTPSLAWPVHLTVSLLENVLAGQQLVLGISMLGAVRPVLELLEVDWAKEEDTSNNSAINPDTRAIKVRHQQLHLHLHLHMHMHMQLNLHMHKHLHMHMHMHRFRRPAPCVLSYWIQRDIQQGTGNKITPWLIPCNLLKKNI